MASCQSRLPVWTAVAVLFLPSRAKNGNFDASASWSLFFIFLEPAARLDGVWSQLTSRRASSPAGGHSMVLLRPP